MLDIDGNGKREYHIAVQSPLHKEWISPDIFNHDNGQTTNLVVREGQVKYIISDQIVTKIEYDNKTGIGLSTVSFPNFAGSRQNFWNLTSDERIKLFDHAIPVAETKTTYKWYLSRDSRVESLDPYNPLIEKKSVDYRDGWIRVDTFGLFDRPIKQVTQNVIRYNFYNNYGLFVRAEVYRNPDGTLYNQPEYDKKGNLELDISSPRPLKTTTRI